MWIWTTVRSCITYWGLVFGKRGDFYSLYAFFLSLSRLALARQCSAILHSWWSGLMKNHRSWCKREQKGKRLRESSFLFPFLIGGIKMWLKLGCKVGRVLIKMNCSSRLFSFFYTLMQNPIFHWKIVIYSVKIFFLEQFSFHLVW